MQRSVVDDDRTELKLHLTSDYAPNSSRKRRVLRTSNVKVLQDCLEDIELVRNLEDE